MVSIVNWPEVVTQGPVVLSQTDTQMSAPASDADLVTLCQRGSVSAYERLYLAYGSRMKSIAFNLLRNRMDAEDAVQETFLKVFRSIQTFQGQAAFSTWVYRILVNTCTDLQRGRRHKTEELFENLHGQQTNLTVKVALERALDKINPRYRAVFLLAEVEGFKHSEIGEILGIPEGTSKNHLFEAKRALQSVLKERRKEAV